MAACGGSDRSPVLYGGADFAAEDRDGSFVQEFERIGGTFLSIPKHMT